VTCLVWRESIRNTRNGPTPLLSPRKPEPLLPGLYFELPEPKVRVLSGAAKMCRKVTREGIPLGELSKVDSIFALGSAGKVRSWCWSACQESPCYQMRLEPRPKRLPTDETGCAAPDNK
jgi:hypothetical protein